MSKKERGKRAYRLKYIHRIYTRATLQKNLTSNYHRGLNWLFLKMAS